MASVHTIFEINLLTDVCKKINANCQQMSSNLSNIRTQDALSNALWCSIEHFVLLINRETAMKHEYN